MTPIDALLSLLARGFKVRVDGRRLMVSPTPVPPDADALIREHKEHWLCLLCDDAGDPWAPGWQGEAFTGDEWEQLNWLRRKQEAT